MPDVEFFGDQLNDPLQVGNAIYDVPFRADPKTYLYRVPFWVKHANFAAANAGFSLDSPGPEGGVFVGNVAGAFRDIAAGTVIEFWREFAIVPDQRIEHESFVYAWQTIGTVDGLNVQLSETPLTVHSQVVYDYFNTTVPESIPLERAPRAVAVAFGSGQAIGGLYGWGSLVPGQLYRAEDDTVRAWKGNIYERKVRLIYWQNLGSILEL